MKQYVIIDIEQNTAQPDGMVLIVKANPVKNADGFEHLEQMFGKKYFNFCMHECNETEVFMLPSSEALIQKLVHIARGYEDGNFWMPNMDDFMDARLSTPNGIIMIHKSLVLVHKQMRAENQKYIPPVANWQFKHKIIEGIEIVTFCATQTSVTEEPNGGFSYDSGNVAFFVYPDDEKHMQMLNDAIKLDPHKKQFWIPDTSDYYQTKISMKGPFGASEHELYISYDLPIDIILDNLQDTLR